MRNRIELPSLEDINKSLAEDCFTEYIKQAWKVLEPNTNYLHNWHIDLIAEYLEAVSRGEITRLIINIPPRYMKSLSVSVFWPTWTWIKKPWTRWLFASYAASLSKKHSVDRRTLIRSGWYQDRWGESVEIKEDQDEKVNFATTEEGVMVATSIGGTATGKGGHYVVVDDPHNPRQVLSTVQRESANEFFDQTLSTRLDNKRTGAIVVVMQRLHEKDLTGHLLERDTGRWVHLKIPAESIGRTTIQMPESKTYIMREDGELLWPDREGQTEIIMAKAALGSRGYAGQYQQDPRPEGGGIVKDHWWKYWCYPGQNLLPISVRLDDGSWHECPVIEIPKVMHQSIQSWDMAFKNSDGSSYVAGQVWARNNANKYLIAQIRRKLDFPGTINAVNELTERYPEATSKLIEDKANGPAVIQMLRSRISGLLPRNPQGSKEARLHAESAQIESGNVYLPHPDIAPWIRDFLSEVSAFPRSEYSDQVDAMTQALGYLPKNIIVAEATFSEPKITSRMDW